MKTFTYSKYISSLAATYTLLTVGKSKQYYKRLQLSFLFVIFFSLSFVSFGQETYKPDAILTEPVSYEGLANFLKEQTGQARMAGPGEIQSPIFGGITGPDSVCSYPDEPVVYSVANMTDAFGNPLQYFWFVPADWIILSGQGTHQITVIPGSLSGQVAVFAMGYCVCTYACKPVISEDCGGITPLPVNLTAFDAARAQTAVLLRWNTAQEVNNEKFEVERSKDGRNFEKLGEIKGKGNTSQNTTYTFEDRQPNSSVTYYRLKQVDFDGKFAYSPVRKVDAKKLSSVTLEAHPNPAVDFVTLQNIDALDQNSTVTIVSVTGQVVFRGTAGELAKTNNRLNISHLTSGVYIANISSGTDTQSIRIVKN